MRAYRLSVNTFLLQMRSVLIHSLSSVNKSHQQTKDVCFLYECVSRPETRSIKTDLNCNKKSASRRCYIISIYRKHSLFLVQNA